MVDRRIILVFVALFAVSMLSASVDATPCHNACYAQYLEDKAPCFEGIIIVFQIAQAACVADANDVYQACLSACPPPAVPTAGVGCSWLADDGRVND